ncbi:MAG TPA: nucleotidyltransferase domain-containing protein [Alphaproteobacteria bacterium]|nr:nucleotidyltransferase domain-containing protein [Alphaproteobacteria bacterium]
MRLTKSEQEIIVEIFSTIFEKNDKLWLFGSRTDDTKKGGDIDLMVETLCTDSSLLFEKKMSFLVELKWKLGDQKIDFLTKTPTSSNQLLDHIIKTGIRLK